MRDNKKAWYNTGDYLQVLPLEKGQMLRILKANLDNNTFLVRVIDQHTLEENNHNDWIVSEATLDKMTNG